MGLMSVTSEPLNLQAEIRLRVAAGGTENLREALRLAEGLPKPAKATAADDVAQTLYELVLHAESLGDWELCSGLYRQVAEYDVANGQIRSAALFRYGICREHQGDYFGAIDAYRRSIPDAAGWPLVEGLARFHLAQLLISAEQYEEAAAILQDLLLFDLPHAELDAGEIALDRARCLWRTERLEEARDLIERPPHPISGEAQIEAKRLLAEIHEARGDTERAAECYRSIVQSDCADPQLKSAASHRLSALVPNGVPMRRAPIAASDRLLLTEAVEGRFLVVANDSGISHAILETGSWAPADVGLFRRLVRPGQTVVDIGANIGHHSVVFSKLVGEGGRVISIEPQAFLFNVLCANLALNDCFNARGYQVAFGDRDGATKMLPIDYNQEGNFGALGLSTHSDWLTGEKVQITTLDKFLATHAIERVDFIKLDVQTFELFVLQGATETLRSSAPALFIEISPYWMLRMSDYDYREIYRLLADHGYEIYDKQFRRVETDRHQATDENTEWDVVAIKRGKRDLPIRAF